MANIKVDDLKCIFRSYLDNPTLSLRRRTELIDVARSTIQKYEKEAQALSLTPEEILSMSEDELSSAFNIHSRDKLNCFTYWRV